MRRFRTVLKAGLSEHGVGDVAEFHDEKRSGNETQNSQMNQRRTNDETRKIEKNVNRAVSSRERSARFKLYGFNESNSIRKRILLHKKAERRLSEGCRRELPTNDALST
ncbi:unnamed protein product [Nippostrongylus brasiliensis]|uniref:Uncharacterized protein n=1 Tax=Nippostrongylus brasiliensis TaxID=27835 RepID=A0A0N4YNT9_NIPBR|nr:unnamed protein product [Nippostrongylus brasiliensis]